MKLVAAILIWSAMVAVASAAPGQCSVTGLDMFECDVVLDGGGLTFDLPDGRTFAFALMEEGVGTGYLIAADAAPGTLPDALPGLVAEEGKPGCWARADFEFCAMVAE